MKLRREFNGVSKLRHYLQVVAFTLVVATIQCTFMPDKPYGPPVVYSVLIGTFTWAIIDLGRELIPSAAETGWPHGWQGIALVLVGIVVGYLAGTLLADTLCVHYFHFYPAGSLISGADQRTSILITAIAGLVGTFYFYAVNKSAYLEGKMAEARMHASESRLKLLETQLEPHMLFNTLANLRVLIGTDPARATAMLDQLGDYLRATLAASRADGTAGSHTLALEFQRLRDYLGLMSVRMGDRLRCTLLREQSKSILRLTTDLPLGCLVFRGHTHVTGTEWIGQGRDHHVEHLAIPHPRPVAQRGREITSGRHYLDPSG